MNTIRFSHEYPKLHGQTSAELLAVRPLKIDAHTPRELIEYDTTHSRGRYPLRSGFYIQLIFLGNLRIPFCTIRSAYPPSKVRYYYSSVGRTFKIETPEPVVVNVDGEALYSDHINFTLVPAGVNFIVPKGMKMFQ